MSMDERIRSEQFETLVAHGLPVPAGRTAGGAVVGMLEESGWRVTPRVWAMAWGLATIASKKQSIRLFAREYTDARHPCAATTQSGSACRINADRCVGGRWYCHHHDPQGEVPPPVDRLAFDYECGRVLPFESVQRLRLFVTYGVIADSDVPDEVKALPEWHSPVDRVSDKQGPLDVLGSSVVFHGDVDGVCPATALVTENGWVFYQTEPVDEWEGLTSYGEDEFSRVPEFVKAGMRAVGWPGDLRGDVWYMGSLPMPLDTPVHWYAWKEDNNGTSYIAAPFDPFNGLPEWAGRYLAVSNVAHGDPWLSSSDYRERSQLRRNAVAGLRVPA